jgi:uncharacterized protein (DUF2164 family)
MDQLKKERSIITFRQSKAVMVRVTQNQFLLKIKPSEDNLDADQILKLIPKKLGKKKYLKGIEEKKKKKEPVTEAKVPKKPKTMLMPCMSQKKDKEVKSTRNASESAVKKQLNTFKFISYRLRNGGKQRDVGT